MARQGKQESWKMTLAWERWVFEKGKNLLASRQLVFVSRRQKKIRLDFGEVKVSVLPNPSISLLEDALSPSTFEATTNERSADQEQ